MTRIRFTLPLKNGINQHKMLSWRCFQFASGGLFGTWPSIFALVLSLLTFDFFFMSPRYNLSMSDPREIVNVLVFLFTAIIFGQ